MADWNLAGRTHDIRVSRADQGYSARAMIQVQGVSKSYGAQVVFSELSFSISRGERLGLVGKNGHGKSTLFRLILGEEDPDEGKIVIPSRYQVGHLEQHLNFTQDTILAEGALGLPADEKEMLYKVESILFGLGFTQGDLERAPSEFSGGYQIRLNLAKLLVSEPNLLLLDEPTNYLDIVSVRWLERFLKAWKNELIIITHDRVFMDRVTTHTMGIHRQKLRKVKGDTEKLYEQLALEEEIHEKTRRNDQKKRADIEKFIDRFRSQAHKAQLVQSRIKALERMPKLDQLSEIESLDFRFTYAPFPAKTCLDVRKITFGYPGGPLLLDELAFSVDKRDRIAVMGKNGMGKSTLLKLIAREMDPKSGEIKRHPDTRIGYFGQTNISRLSPAATVEDEVQNANPANSRTRVRGICGLMMFSGDTAEKKVAVLSGGEKSRTLLGKILAQPSNVLLLDEPTSHLDMDSIEALVDALDRYEGAVVIVTHSEMILRRVAKKCVYFQGGAARIYPGTYDEFLERIGWDHEEDVW